MPQRDQLRTRIVGETTEVPEWYEEACQRLKTLLPRQLPENWRKIEDPRAAITGKRQDNIRWFQHQSLLSVAVSVQQIEGKWWLHVSLSRPQRLPNWDEYRAVKLLFVGPHRQAIQVLPRVSSYVNIHPNCLHLWTCLEPGGDGLPDFTEYV